jgi:hypothetical protein
LVSSNVAIGDTRAAIWAIVLVIPVNTPANLKKCQGNTKQQSIYIVHSLILYYNENLSDKQNNETIVELSYLGAISIWLTRTEQKLRDWTNQKKTMRITA